MKEDQNDSFVEENDLNDKSLDLIVRKFRKILFNKRANGKQKEDKKFLVKKHDYEIGIKINLEEKDKVK